MKKVLLVLIIFTAIACDRSPRLLVDKSAGFSVMMPGRPKEKQMTPDAYVYWVKNQKDLYLVSYWDGEEPSFFEFGIPLVDLAQQHEKSSKNIDLQGLWGYETKMYLVARGIRIITRDYQEGNRTFRIQVVFNENQKHWMDPERFMDSFQFLIDSEEELE